MLHIDLSRRRISAIINAGMPELPDIILYIEALESRIVSQPLQRVRLASPFLVRSVDPPIGEAEGKKVLGLQCTR